MKATAPAPPVDAGYAAVVGDVIASRRGPDRRGLQERLDAALAAVNERVPALQPLTITVGDEFQALYARLDEALAATLLIRLRLLPLTDVRCGVGWGALLTFDPARVPLGQDGPAWWAARDAVDDLRATARQPEAPRGLRTVFRKGQPPPVEPPSFDGLPAPQGLPGDVEGWVNGLLVCRDELIASMDERDLRLLNALIAGEKQTEVAAGEGISQSAVAQRYARNGAYALRSAHPLIQQRSS